MEPTILKKDVKEVRNCEILDIFNKVPSKEKTGNFIVQIGIEGQI